MIAVSTPEMRAVLAATLEDLMSADERIVIVNADLGGAHKTAGLAKIFPGRVFNVGVQEANMASFAAGMATYGFIPFIVTFAPFATRRIADQLAISIAYARTNVKIIGGDPGVAAELNGGTHMTFADVGYVRSVAKMVVVEPADARQLAGLLPQIVAYPGPVYMRLFRKVRPDIYDEGQEFDLMRADVLREGTDVTLFASGIEVAEALAASEILALDGIDAEVINVATIKPLDEATVLASVRKTGVAVTCENHNVMGGLGSAITEVTAGAHPVPVLRIGSQDEFGEVGKLPYLVERFGLTSTHIAAAAIRAVQMKSATAVV